ncbi:sulfate/thiosulfate ABC transporter ATP-binding protein CysA [Blochmannia endosymbiont of Camponotus modoc]|uniref:sulfate/thiosulfate ABC transporter ATP-binding protein CysA n=1 Tax=Blochmannia endosymbiont of Camponotus modoc TaxID=2945587 RepID=UPI002024D8E2|nr:sulfate/thiosulfate ABC transporter ATP-binding protein CysA [Blochmannia endosymbiont of Camponotus modoc]URJ26293.1 sulfate/thiosulfate ABC transporter ATP-binding protein CysA [Blochmannia endosymbiont of Camponotus modoc]URJ31668.1 sulfate/thiosulfate ABC transporter ATP-binding protein CysA [Blochmannia endosymbiont of Camponotus modoc]
MSIEIDGITKFFGHDKILTNVSLHIESGEIIALLGPSGSGKTTLLRIIAGLEHYNSGCLRFRGKDVSHLSARDRHVGFVFQNYALFRHMTVSDNISFGIRMLPRHKRPNSHIISKKVTQLLSMVQLERLANRYPTQLSGGQKQRVALARSLAIEPEILLLDEPFGALDTQVRKELRRWLRKLHNEFKFTSVFVTHDQEEAMEVANRIVVMNRGVIEQIGTPKDIWCVPATRFVLEFISEVNCLQGVVCGSELFIGPYHWSLPYIPALQGKVELFFRPWEMDMSKEHNVLYPLPAKIVNVSLHGYYWQLSVEPLGWHQDLLTIILGIKDIFGVPECGAYCYLSGRNARLYSGEIVL